MLASSNIGIYQTDRFRLNIAFQITKHASDIFYAFDGDIAIVYLHDTVCFISSVQHQVVIAMECSKESSNRLLSFHQRADSTNLDVQIGRQIDLAHQSSHFILFRPDRS